MNALPDNPDEHAVSKYSINIENKDYQWDSPWITLPQIRELSGIPDDQPVLEIDLATQTERTLPEDEVVHLESGRGYSKKVKFQRGDR